MSHYVTDLDGERKPRKLPDRELDTIETRILGSLAEKQMATPEYYPLSLNALVAACNQKSNREPVLELSDSDVQSALDRLQSEKLVWKVMGGRVVRWEHNLDATLQLDRPSKAVLTLLFCAGHKPRVNCAGAAIASMPLKASPRWRRRSSEWIRWCASSSAAPARRNPAGPTFSAGRR